jgi:hypothetical protein
MENEDRYTLDEAQTKVARLTNQRVWQLLENDRRSLEEDDEMVLAAQASLYHWGKVGTRAQLQRGYWLLSHVFSVLLKPAQAVKFAKKCMQTTLAFPKEMKDFDLAYAYEWLARAYALEGNKKLAAENYDLAQKAGMNIADDEDRQIFMNDFNSGSWYSIHS